MKKIIAASLCIILIFTGSQAAFALEASFTDEIKAGNYLKAVEIYKRDILGNAGQELQAQDELLEYLNDSFDQFINDLLTDQEMQTILYTAEKVNNELYIFTPDVIGNAQLIYREISFSKDNYAEGIACMEQEDYDSAIDYFEYVSSYDILRYETAQIKIQECHIAICNHLLDEAVDYAKEGNYYEAFMIAEEEVSQYPEATYGYTVRDRYSSLYVDQTIKEAREIYQETGDYDQAGALLKRCLSVVGASEKLDSEIAWYESRKPVSLTEIPCIENENKGLKKSYLDTDIFGTVYDDYPVLTAGGYPSRKTAPSSSTYFLNGEYSTFTGTIFLSDAYKDTKSTGYVRIYGDGVLLFEEKKNKKGILYKRYHC